MAVPQPLRWWFRIEAKIGDYVCSHAAELPGCNLNLTNKKMQKDKAMCFTYNFRMIYDIIWYFYHDCVDIYLNW